MTPGWDPDGWERLSEFHVLITEHVENPSDYWLVDLRVPPADRVTVVGGPCGQDSLGVHVGQFLAGGRDGGGHDLVESLPPTRRSRQKPVKSATLTSEGDGLLS